jgi:uncharacterized protein YkwD
MLEKYNSKRIVSMKKTRIVVSTVLISIAACATVLAGAWKQNAAGWWYDNGDGTYPAGKWEWLDGNGDGVAECYYFYGNGYMAANTMIEGYPVNANGAWTDAAGNVQTKLVNTQVNTQVSDTIGSSNLNHAMSDSEIYNLLTGTYNSAADPTKELNDKASIEKVVEFVNILRSKKGLSEVVMDDTLMEAAQIRAEEASQKFSHTRPNGADCFTALDELGWPQDTHAAENLAQGQKTALQVVNAWYHSSGHKHNMLHEKNGTIGVGISGTGYSKTWAQMFSE